MQAPFKLTTIAIVNTVLLIAGLTCIISGCFKLITGDIALATTGLGSGLLLLFSATIDRFESLKGMSLEVTTRKLDDKLIEADNAVQELKQLAEISGHTLSLLGAKVGRWDSAFTFDEGYTLAQQIRENLSNLKCDKIAIAHALQPWVKVVLSDLSRALLNPVNIELREIEKNLRTELNKRQQTSTSTNENHLEITTRIQNITDHLSKKFEISLSMGNEAGEAIKAYIMTAPEINNESKEKYLSEINNWSTEINHLLKNSAVLNKQLWIEALNKN